jgi:hypothetical protein
MPVFCITYFSIDNQYQDSQGIQLLGDQRTKILN